MLDSRQMEIVGFLTMDGVACEGCARNMAATHGAPLDDYRTGLAADDMLRPLTRFEADEDHAARMEDAALDDPAIDAADPDTWSAYTCDICGGDIEL